VTIDLTTPAAQDAALARGFAETDPRRRGAAALEGQELRAAILRLREDGKSMGVIADELGCSRAYVGKVCASGPTMGRGRGRPRVLRPIELSEAMVEQMVDALRAGVTDLLTIPGVAECVPVLPKTTEAGDEAADHSRRVRLGQFIASGEHAPEGAARRLWQARQEGLLRRQGAA